MNTVLTVATYVSLTLFFIYGFAFLSYCRSITKSRFKATSWFVIGFEEIPDELRPCLEAPRALLEGLGFIYRCSFFYTPLIDLPSSRNQYGVEYSHAETGARAKVYANPLLPFPCYIEYVTAFTNGGLWSTLNGIKHQLIPGENPGEVHFDDYLRDDRAAWEKHRQRVAACEETVERNEDAIDRLSAFYNSRELEERLKQGVLRRSSEDGGLYLTWPQAFLWACRLTLGRFKARPILRQTIQSLDWKRKGEADTLVLGKEMADSSRQSPRGRLTSTILSGILFALVGFYFFGVFITLMLIIVLAFHEAGHYTAMRLTGHHSVGVYFIPGLGALTTAERKSRVAPLQQLAIYLAGPVPGIILYLSLWPFATDIFSDPDIAFKVRTLLHCFLAVNYFNLLPVIPLDGGCIIDTLLLSRFPRLRFCFALFSVSMWGFVGYLSLSSLIGGVFVFALLAFFLIPTQWRHMMLRLSLGTSPANTEEEARERALEALQAQRFSKWSQGRRLIAASTAIRELNRLPVTGLQAFCCAFIYGICLCLPFLLSEKVRGVVYFLLGG